MNIDDYKPACISLASGSVSGSCSSGRGSLMVTTDLDSLAEALRTMHRSDATPAELLAELVAKLTTPTPGAQV